MRDQIQYYLDKMNKRRIYQNLHHFDFLEERSKRRLLSERDYLTSKKLITGMRIFILIGAFIIVTMTLYDLSSISLAAGYGTTSTLAYDEKSPRAYKNNFRSIVDRELSKCPNPRVFPEPTIIKNKQYCESKLVNEDFESSTSSTYNVMKSSISSSNNNWISLRTLGLNSNSNNHVSSLNKDISSKLIKNDKSYTNSKTYLRISNRATREDGVIIPLNPNKLSCIVPKVPYFFRVDIKVSGVLQGESLQLKFVSYDHQNKYSNNDIQVLSTLKNIIESEWITWSDVVTFDRISVLKKKRQNTEAYYFIINGIESSSSISIDNLQIYLPPYGHYPDPNSVCDELIVNGDLSQSDLFPFPIKSSTSKTALEIHSSDFDQHRNYLTMQGRTQDYHGPKIELIPGCLMMKGSSYALQYSIRIRSQYPTKSHAVLQYTDSTPEKQVKFDVIATCPESSIDIGWVECFGTIQYHPEFNPPFHLGFITNDSIETTDWRSLSLKPIKCGRNTSTESKERDPNCLRQVQVTIEPQYSKNLVLMVRNEEDIDDSQTQIISSGLEVKVEAAVQPQIRHEILEEMKLFKTKQEHDDVTSITTKRIFEFSLSSGDYISSNNWIGSFHYQNDFSTSVSVTYADVVLGDLPSCSEVMNSFVIEQSLPPMRKCSFENLIETSTFSPDLPLAQTHWYHNGAGMRYVKFESSDSVALSTLDRTSKEHGLFTYLDASCLTEKVVVVGQTSFNITAKYKLDHSISFHLQGSNRHEVPVNCQSSEYNCPRASLILYQNGLPIHTIVNVATALTQKKRGWNEINGSFTISKEFMSADKIIFLVNGAAPNIDIIINEIYISKHEEKEIKHDMQQKHDDEGNCIMNGGFEQGDSDHWKCIGVKCSLGMIQLPPSDKHKSKFAVTALNRASHTHGIVQQLDLNCFRKFQQEQYYQVRANVLLQKEETNAVISCDPFSYFQGSEHFCPLILVRALDPNDPYHLNIRAASIIKTGQADAWYQMYGILKVSNDLLNHDSLYLYIGWAPPHVNIMIDNVSITPIRNNQENKEITLSNAIPDLHCEDLIKNGNAEIGDARFWYIKGHTEYGSISVLKQDNNNHFFYHDGVRTKAHHGMWQELPKSCLYLGSTWKITATFKLIDAATNMPISCQQNKNCPMFRLEAYNGHGSDIVSKSLTNQLLIKRWNVDSWNAYEHVFEIDEELFSRERIFIFIFGIQADFNYMVDDIAITRHS